MDWTVPSPSPFRPFSDAITEFISARGFDGDFTDVDAKVKYIKTAFEKANMTPPRELREWFTAGQPIKRDTAFLICFAFGLDGGEAPFAAQVLQLYLRHRSNEQGALLAQHSTHPIVQSLFFD